MKKAIIYSSLTGNTEKVANEILKVMPSDTNLYNVKDIEGEVEEEFLVLGYWVDRAKPNKEILELMEKLQGKTIATFGTLGDYPDSKHAEETKGNVIDILGKDNKLLGNFLCQGKINPKITEMFKKGLAGPHNMTEERLKKHEEAAKHPNQEDFKAAQDFIKDVLQQL